MMTFIALIAGLLGIIGVARYNNSDKLFWVLATAWIGTFMAAKVATTVIDSMKQNEVVVTSAIPTQVHESVSCIPYTLAEISLAATRREKSQKPVSKVFVTGVNDNILSEVLVSARGQPQVKSVFPILRGPDYFDTS